MAKKYELVDVEKPELYRDIYPYDEVPRIVFDGKSVPMNLPKDFWISDTTFRDGQQARPPYTVKQIVDLYDMMHRLGGPKGVIRQSEFFLYSDKDREAVEKCLEMGYKYPEVTGWIRAVKSDFQLVKEMGLKETGILTSSSDYHIFLKLKKNRRQAMDGYLDIVRSAVENGIRCRCHFEDITRADVYGFCVPFAQEIMKISEESGVLVRIRLCDTMGYGLFWPETKLPRSIPKLIHALIQDAGFPSERLEWHGHNDFHKVHANSAAAWVYGCAAVNATLLSTGERTGNSPIEGLIMEYIGLKGAREGVDTKVITEIGDYYQKEIGMPIAPNYPFLGSSFNVTRAGIHADGVFKNEEIYNIFDTGKILNRPLGVTITDKSGMAGIAWWVNHRLGLEGAKRIDKKHPGVAKIHKWVEAQYAQRRTTGISDPEMIEQAKKYLSEYFA